MKLPPKIIFHRKVNFCETAKKMYDLANADQFFFLIVIFVLPNHLSIIFMVPLNSSLFLLFFFFQQRAKRRSKKVSVCFCFLVFKIFIQSFNVDEQKAKSFYPLKRLKIEFSNNINYVPIFQKLTWDKWRFEKEKIEVLRKTWLSETNCSRGQDVVIALNFITKGKINEDF